MATDCSIAVSKPQTVPIDLTGQRAALIGTSGYSTCWNGAGQPIIVGKVNPFRLNLIGNVTTQYDSDGNLWAILSDAKAVPSAANSTRNSGISRAPWYGSVTSNIAAWRAIAIAAVVTLDNNPPAVPAENSPAWHKCLGQWYAAGVTCGGDCETSYGNPPGGTQYIWNDYNNAGDTPGFSKVQGQNGTRKIPEQRWNLGKVRYGNGIRPRVWIIVQPQQYVGNNNPNCNLAFRANSMVAGASVDVQTLIVCPPEISHVGEEHNICNSCVDVKLTIDASDLGGLEEAELEIEYRYKGGEWIMGIQEHAKQGEEYVLALECLIGSQDIEIRARYVIAGDYDAQSEYTYYNYHTGFVPSVDMTVPDIETGDCTTIKKGGLIPQFTEPTCYNEYACVEAKIPDNLCDTIEAEMAEYEDPGCKDRGSK